VYNRIVIKKNKFVSIETLKCFSNRYIQIILLVTKNKIYF